MTLGKRTPSRTPAARAPRDSKCLLLRQGVGSVVSTLTLSFSFAILFFFCFTGYRQITLSTFFPRVYPKPAVPVKGEHTF